MNSDRQYLQFAETVTQVFAFLQNYGFQQVEALPTLVRYKCGDLEARVFHGRHSYELGFEIGHDEELFSLEALIRLSDRTTANQYRNPMVGTPSAVARFLQQLADMVRRYGERALRNDPACYEVLRQQRKEWSEQYALEVRSGHVRPKAEEAFREGRYREAAELYREIRAGLTPAEIKKLAIAEKRSLGGT
jgi:hypothetical protein